MSVKEILALILSASFVWGPLFGGLVHPKGEGNSNQQREENDDYPLKIITLALGAANVAVLIVQSRIFGEQVSISRDLASVTHRQADASELQAQISLKQEELLFQQKEIMRQTFLLSHRPHLRIHSVRLRAPKINTRPEDQPVRAWFVLVNTGMSEARIVSNLVLLEYLDPEDRLHLRITRQNGVIPNLTFEVGEERTLATSSDTNIDLAWTNFIHSLPRDDDPKRLHFHGWVIYNDAAERRRTLYFCSIYDETIGRFKPIDDPEANCTY